VYAQLALGGSVEVLLLPEVCYQW